MAHSQTPTPGDLPPSASTLSPCTQVLFTFDQTQTESHDESTAHSMNDAEAPTADNASQDASQAPQSCESQSIYPSLSQQSTRYPYRDDNVSQMESSLQASWTDGQWLSRSWQPQDFSNTNSVDNSLNNCYAIDPQYGQELSNWQPHTTQQSLQTMQPVQMPTSSTDIPADSATNRFYPNQYQMAQPGGFGFDTARWPVENQLIQYSTNQHTTNWPTSTMTGHNTSSFLGSQDLVPQPNQVQNIGYQPLNKDFALVLQSMQDSQMDLNLPLGSEVPPKKRQAGEVLSPQAQRVKKEGQTGFNTFSALSMDSSDEENRVEAKKGSGRSRKGGRGKGNRSGPRPRHVSQPWDDLPRPIIHPLPAGTTFRLPKRQASPIDIASSSLQRVAPVVIDEDMNAEEKLDAMRHNSEAGINNTRARQERNNAAAAKSRRRKVIETLSFEFNWLLMARSRDIWKQRALALGFAESDEEPAENAGYEPDPQATEARDYGEGADEK